MGCLFVKSTNLPLSCGCGEQFVLDVASAYGLPVLGNLRNGLWYVPPSFLSGKCYFKSTDGHDGQWTMSTTRLNLNVAEIAAECGGCIVVDSTRSGKVRRRAAPAVPSPKLTLVATHDRSCTRTHCLLPSRSGVRSSIALYFQPVHRRFTVQNGCQPQASTSFRAA